VSELVVMIGPSGSGKSTWLARRFTKTQIVCLDTLRGVLTDDEGNQEVNPEVVDLRARILNVRCSRRLRTAVDSTSLYPEHRSELTLFAHLNGMMPIAVVMETPLEVCIEQNKMRDRVVPEDVIRRQHAQFVKSVGSTGNVHGFAVTRRIRERSREIWTDPDWTFPADYDYAWLL
jgi:predicted kinase